MQAPPAIGQGCRSLPERAVAEVYDASSESALIEELKVGAHAGRQPWLAPADDNGPDEQLALVDQPGLESLRREVGTSYGEIAAGRGFSSCTAAGSKRRSSRVSAVDTAARVVEYTTLLAACQALAKSAMRSDRAVRAASVSQTAIASYSRRP